MMSEPIPSYYTPPTLVRQTILKHSVGDDYFRIVLRTDGSGYLYDQTYEDLVEIENHGLDLEALASDNLLELGERRDVEHPSPYSYDELESGERSTDEGDDFHQLISRLFMKYNGELQNPVGEPPEDDEKLTVNVGTEEIFLKTIHAVSYLAKLANFESDFAIETGTNGGNATIEEGCDEIEEILYAILDVFEPEMTHWDYTDENDGRITSHAPSGVLIYSYASQVKKYFPSARERLEIRPWLTETFRTYGIDTQLISHTFDAENA
jgi:hypothetical protein